jgi:hypothetical protein
MAATQRPVRDAALGEAFAGPPAWKSIPSWFVIPELDQNIPLQYSVSWRNAPKLAISSRWKGPRTPFSWARLRTITITTPGSSASCGVTFEQGKEYVVYAQVSDGVLSRSARLRLLVDAAQQHKLRDGNKAEDDAGECR